MSTLYFALKRISILKKARVSGISLSLGMLLMQSCAVLYSVQMTDLDQTQCELIPFEIKVSEFGIDGAKVAQIGAIVTSGQTSNNLKAVRDIMAIVQFGPRTGNPVYSEKYADQLAQAVYQQCPSGKLTGLASYREARNYTAVSGEIVKVKGFCILENGKRPSHQNSELPEVALPET